MRSPGALQRIFLPFSSTNSGVYFRAFVYQSIGFSAQRDPRICGNKFYLRPQVSKPIGYCTILPSAPHLPAVPPTASPPVRPSARPPIHLYLSICLSIYLSIYLCTYLSIYLSIYVSIYLSIYVSIYPFIHPSNL